MKKAIIYSAILCVVSWIIALVFHLTTGYTGPETDIEAVAKYQTFGMTYMWLPAIMAFIMQAIGGQLGITRPHATRIKIALKNNNLIKFRPRWSWLVAILLVPAMVGLSIVISSLFAEVTSMSEGTLALMKANGMEEVPAEVLTQLNAVPEWVMLLSTVLSSLIAGVTINALFAFGEEYGWRCYLVDVLRGERFWRAAPFIGAVWGIWHAPLILMGHNYPNDRVAGIFMMVAFCILGGIIELYFVCKSGTVWPAVFIHGTINALAGLCLIMVPGGNALLTGMTGVAGFAAMAMVIAALYLYDCHISRERIFTSTLGASLERHRTTTSES